MTESALRPVSRPAAAASRVIDAYQRYLSPWLGSNCRFYPSCSSYAREAITRFGLLRGGWLTVRRLARCQPFSRGGYDPVPCARHAAAPRDADDSASG